MDSALDEWQPFVGKVSFLKEKTIDYQGTIAKLRHAVDTGALPTSLEVIEEYSKPVVNLLEISNLAVNQKTTGGIGKAMSSAAILPEAQESAARFRGLMSGIIASQQKVSNRDTLFMLIRDLEGIEINLTSPALIQSARSQEVIDRSIHGSDFMVLKSALLEVFKTGAAETDKPYLTSYQEVWRSSTAIVDELNTLIQSELGSLYDRSQKIERNYLIEILAALLILVYSFANSIRKPILKVSRTFKTIAAGSGDLSEEIDVDSRGELADMARDFNSFTSKLSDLIRGIRAETEILREIGYTLQSSIDQTASSSRQIAASLEAIRSNIVHQAASVTESYTTLDQFLLRLSELKSGIDTQTAAVTESASSIRQMLSTIEKVQNSLHESNREVEHLVRTSEQGKERLNPLMEQIQTITEQSKKLQEANSVIADIASRTNLLAMNAAIEAAHAGEHGRGFAVVAGEIRKLAENASNHSKDISKNLKNIQSVMEQVLESSKKVQSSFDAIQEGIVRVNANRAQIDFAMREQSIASREVMTALDEITQVTTKVNSFAGEIEVGSKEINSEMRNLLQITEEIKAAIHEANQGVQEILRSTEQVSQESTRNYESIEKIYSGFSSFSLKGEGA